MARQTYSWNNVKLNEQQVAQVLWQAGMRDLNMIALMVPIAMRESGGQAGVHGSASPRDQVMGDRGLFQINALSEQGTRVVNVDGQPRRVGVRDASLIEQGLIQRPEDLFDPVINAKVAIHLAGNGSRQGMEQLWGLGTVNGRTTWVGIGGSLPAPRMDVVQAAQSSGLLGQPFNSTAAGAPGPVTSGAASGAAGPLANPGSGELGFVNANAQNQRGYYNEQMGYLGEIYNLGQKRTALEFTELEANRVYQLALQGIYENVNSAKGVFNTKEYNNLKTSLAELKSLQDQGYGQTKQYHDAQRKLERQVYDATVGYLQKQRTTAQQTLALAKAESAFVWGENVRKRSSEAISKGARLAEGTGQDMASYLKQRQLQDTGSQIQYDAEGNRIYREAQQASYDYQDQAQDRNYQQQQYNLQYRQNLSDIRSRERDGSLKYQQTAKEIWAKARELDAQKTLNKKLVDNQYQGIRIGRDIDYAQYQQSHHSLNNQFQQVGVNQVRDIQQLNQRRQEAANAALLSLSPYG